MSRLIHVIVVTDGRRHNMEIVHSMVRAKALAEDYYRQHPRRWNRHVELVDSATGEVTTL